MVVCVWWLCRGCVCGCVWVVVLFVWFGLFGYVCVVVWFWLCCAVLVVLCGSGSVIVGVRIAGASRVGVCRIQVHESACQFWVRALG